MTHHPTAIATDIVVAHNLYREFRTGHRTIQVLKGIDLAVRSGELVVLRGRSGSGKTTLLNILVGLDDPTQGQVTILGNDLTRLNESARAALRSNSTGLLFPNAHLFPTLTAQENVEVALRLQLLPAEERTQRALKALEMVGLAQRAQHRSVELSGGEQQRTALARALVHQPQLVIADEPTGALDSHTSQRIIKLFREIVQETGIAMLIATHDAAVVNAADRVLNISDGRLM